MAGREGDVDFEVMEHPEGVSLFDFFLSVMRRLRDSDADYGIRLEDDVKVNRHFIHNVRKWPALEERDFGAGWLFASCGMFTDGMKLRRSRVSRELYRPTANIHCALAVLLPVKLLRSRLYDLMAKKDHPQQDFAMSNAVWDAELRCYLHNPALVENLMLPSTRGHHDHTVIGHSAGPYFEPDFKR